MQRRDFLKAAGFGFVSLKNPSLLMRLFGIKAAASSAEVAAAKVAASTTATMAYDPTRFISPLPPLDGLKPVAELLADLAIRPSEKTALDNLILASPSYISENLQNFTSTWGNYYQRNEGYRKSKFEICGRYNYGLREASSALARIYFLRGLDEETKSSIHQAITFKQTTKDQFFSADFGALPIEGAMEFATPFLTAWSSPQTRELAKETKKVINYFPEDITDLDQWLNTLEQKIYADVKTVFDPIYLERRHAREALDLGFYEHNTYGQVTKENIKILALQILNTTFEKGLAPVHGSFLSGYMDKIPFDILKTLQLEKDDNQWEYPPSKTLDFSPYDKQEGIQFFAVTLQHSPSALPDDFATPFAIRPAEHKSAKTQIGMDIDLQAMSHALEEQAAQDYARFKKRMDFRLALQGEAEDDPYYTVHHPDETPQRPHLLHSADLAQNVYSFAAQTLSSASRAADQHWQQQGDIFFQRYCVPAGQSVQDAMVLLKEQLSEIAAEADIFNLPETDQIFVVLTDEPPAYASLPKADEPEPDSQQSPDTTIPQL